MKTSFEFLSQLKRNNDREWFNANKPVYQESKAEFEHFARSLMERMQEHDSIDTVNSKVFRIFRDTRFSKDKTPYKTWWAVHIKRLGKANRGGYYLKVEPGSSFVGGGFYGPEQKDLLHIRQQISGDPDPLRKIISEKSFQKYYGEIRGDKVKTAPKGFSKEDPALDLIQFKGMYFAHDFGDKDVLSSKFLDQADEGMKKLRPFFDYMSDILTTDLDGHSLL